MLVSQSKTDGCYIRSREKEKEMVYRYIIITTVREIELPILIWSIPGLLIRTKRMEDYSRIQGSR